MADVKQILVVDDHFEMLELLRSMLRLAGHDYQVFAVPSAEEGMLELLRTRLDLLITDVRLPGMSGFDFVRRIRRRQPDLPVIMITAYASAQGQKEAEELGVYRYFAKPLDTDAVLTAVHTALFGDPPPPPPAEPAPAPLPVQIPDTVQRRLQTLQMDTGATGLLFSTTGGQILLALGDNSRLDLPRIVSKVAENVKNSLVLSDLLGEETPFTIQYHTGNATELYNANVGRDYFVTLIFGLESRRGRIGTIWVFAQRALRDLVTMLPPQSGLKTAVVQPLVSLSSPPPARSSRAAAAVPPPASPTRPVQPPEIPAAEQQESLIAAALSQLADAPSDAAPPESPFVPSPAPTEADIADLLSALNLDESALRVDLDDFWAQAVTQPPDTPIPAAAPGAENTLSWQEASAMLNELPAALRDGTAVSPAPPDANGAKAIVEAVPQEDVNELLAALNLPEVATAVDLDAFWEEALQEAEIENPARGLSFEEAMQRGLIHLDEGDN